MIKIFSVGNSFAEDAHRWLPDICAADGVEVKAVNPFIGGQTFRRHLRAIEAGTEYELLIDSMRVGKNTTFMDALNADTWDIFTFNQGSVQSGMPHEYYPSLNEIYEIVHRQSPNAKPYIFQTWAYEYDADHPYFCYYANDQQEMYRRSRECYELASRMLNAPVIPAGEVIQYLRENEPLFDYRGGKGMSLNRDGYHLDYLYGRYAVALTWYAVLFGGDALANTFVPHLDGVETDMEKIEVIRHAVKKIVDRGFVIEEV